MSGPGEQELRDIAWCMVEAAHFGRSIEPRCPAVAVLPAWRMAEARAAWSLGARHDGRGALHGPVPSLSSPSPPRGGTESA